MSARDELAKVVDDHRWVGTVYTKDRPYECACGERTNDHDAHRADAILAAGYRKVDIVPQEFLDSLPDEAPGLLAAVKEVRERLANEQEHSVIGRGQSEAAPNGPFRNAAFTRVRPERRSPGA